MNIAKWSHIDTIDTIGAIDTINTICAIGTIGTIDAPDTFTSDVIFLLLVLRLAD